MATGDPRLGDPQGMATGPDGTTGWFVYEWNAWRVDPEKPSAGILHYAAGEVVHRYWDGIEELAIKVLGEYRQAVHPERSGLTAV